MAKPRKSRRRKRLPNGARAIMASRIESNRSFDSFWTPPWATRALMEIVLPHLGWTYRRIGLRKVWEPACGEGHMAAVLAEYFGGVFASDITDYGYGDDCDCDFLTLCEKECAFHWIITNPPFGDKTLPFIFRALDLAREGVAMFVRTQWACEGVERYQKLFRDRPPTLFAPFVERVNLCKGRWDPDGTTATAYCWLVWIKGRDPMPTFWIPPGQRRALTRPDDRARFAAWSLPQVREAAE